MRRRRMLHLLLLLPLVVLAGCADKESAEGQIRQMIDTAESVLEARDLRAARSLLSDAYRDAAERTKPALLRLLGGYFLRHKSIHLLLQIERIELQDPQRPGVTLYAAMAGQPFADLDALLALDAALYRFDLELVREQDQWRVAAGSWRSATREDFLGIARP